MKKIFFIFAMLLMSVVSVWAEESYETFSLTHNTLSYTGDHFTVEGTGYYRKTNYKDYCLKINDGNTITISAIGNERITKIEYSFDVGKKYASNVRATKGVIRYDDVDYKYYIDNVNSTSLEISSVDLDASQYVTIKGVTIYYTNEPVVDEYEKEETFTTTSGNQYIGEYINITGTNGNSYGLKIDNGNSVTVTSNNGAKILKVDLHFNYYLPANTDTRIKCDVSADITRSGNDWCIDNVNTTSLTISHPGVGENYEVKIDKITVYYAAPSTIEVALANVGGAYWTTFYSSIANYQAPEGTHVYKVGLNGSKISMTEIEDRIVTKGQGVVLKNLTEGNISLTKVGDESSDDYSGNDLVGTSTTIANPDPGNVYVLNYKEAKGVGFYKLKSTGSIAANKAYLHLSGSATAQEFFAFDATVTGVDSINAQDSEEEKVYDLQGRRIAKPAKGVYIVNGKKVIMK